MEINIVNNRGNESELQLLLTGSECDPAGIALGASTSLADVVAAVITNSTFRNICIGMNEAYFTPDGANASANFGFGEPFGGGLGNQYAQVIHETSNSYGFPYADSHLKVLLQATPSEPITLTICEDDVAFGYDTHPPEGGNQPGSGDYQFGIGAGSSALGTITIGNYRYDPSSEGAYGGFLPTRSEWTKICFTGVGPDAHIWFNIVGDGAVSAGDCFAPAPTFESKVLTWGADVTWAPGASSPAEPA